MFLIWGFGAIIKFERIAFSSIKKGFVSVFLQLNTTTQQTIHMKIILTFILATFIAASLALNQQPIDAIPYCRVVENGFTTDANGDTFVLSDYLCSDHVAFAIFHNGQETGFDLASAIRQSGFTEFLGVVRENHTINNPPALGVVYDIGTDYCRGGIGIVDGTIDAVDGAMSITFDGIAYGNVPPHANLTTNCSPTTVSFTLGSDVLPKGLIMKRTFYFPTGT